MHVTINKIELFVFNTESTSINLNWSRNFDMVGKRILKKEDFSTNVTIFSKQSEIEI